MNEDEVHPVPWVGEGTVPDVPRHDERRGGSLLRFAAGTAAVALAVGVGGGVVARDLIGQRHESHAGVTSSPTGRDAAQAPVQAPAPAPNGEEHEESD